MKLFLSLLTFFTLIVATSFSQNPDGAIPLVSFTTVQTATSYTIPPTNGSTIITSVLVRIWGGGGNGKSNGNNRYGGGGGSFVTFVIPKSRLDISRSLTITVGGNEVSSVVVHNTSPTVTFIANAGITVNKGASITNPNVNYTQFFSYSGGEGSYPTPDNNLNGAGGGSGKLNFSGGDAAAYIAGAGQTATFGTGGTGGSGSNVGLFPGGGGSGSAFGGIGAVYIYDFSTGALPVTLSSFTAKQTTDNNVSLAWITSSESVNKGFSIERQEEGSGKFQSLGFIASKAEGGNSQTTLAYSFKDVTAKKGTNMYRLVQEDLDGKKTYSEVRVVKLNGQSVSMVFPNPSNGAVNISRTADGKKMNIQVIDQSGTIIRQLSNITDANYKLNIQKSGVYTIKMTYPETGEQSIQRIVVQK